MFGYLQIQKSELKVREYEAYKAVYCGLCKQLGKDYSFLTRLTLSYDGTFYALLLMSLSKSCTGFRDGRCQFQPLKKCKYALCGQDCYSKASALSVITAYYKLKDDLLDSGLFKRLAVHLIMPIFSGWHRKGAKRYPEIEKIVSDMMQAQYQAEHSNHPSIDRVAHPTAEMLSAVLSLEADCDTDQRVYREFGYQLGRWIYLIDAADDYEKDKKSGSFNPFLNINDADDVSEYMLSTLNQSLARAYDAYAFIEIHDFKGILDNMMLFGFPAKQNAVLAKRQEVKNE